MKIVRANECRRTPWKNGGGSTTEIAISPPGASLNAFDWRISMGHIASDGPFSEFPGIDRTLAVVGGNGLSLTIGSAQPVVLDRNTAPVSFPGDTPTSARLLAGEIVDLNVMTLRDQFEHRLLQVRQPIDCDFIGYDVAVVVAPFDDVCLYSADSKATTLACGDAAILMRETDFKCQIAPAAAAACYLVVLRQCRGQIGRT
ncbi:HutD family protein [Bradyrhizobium zhanjiangense]|uniref:HutD/Ves family protein n=1 Tax=Bradyrhizobium zhanjiangense TaxID=1325107 RepID=UPI0010089570|nr:HutD family protein [Bradyrhizobium zhanjiangense]